MLKREDLNFYLQYLPLQDLKNIEEEIYKCVKCEVLQEPNEQTLMLPIKDPISNGEFYGGEVLVSTTQVCLYKGNLRSLGFAMVLDDNKEYSKSIAVIDGYFGFSIEDGLTSRIKKSVLKAKELKKAKDELHNQKVDSTRVQFEIM